MNSKERDEFWEAIENCDDPLLSALHSLVERWGLPAIVMSLGEISKVLSEDAESANLTPNQRGLIIGCCAQVSSLSDQMHAEMEFLQEHH
jgi:hypothetical protein